MRALLLMVAIAFASTGAFAKGGGVGLWMEGQVTDVRAEGRNIHLVVNGRFWLDQYRSEERSFVEVSNLRDGGPARIPATIVQGKPFFAMVDGWRGGAIRERGALLQLLRAASESGQTVKFELINARLKFGPRGSLAVEGAEVIRATDHALR